MPRKSTRRTNDRDSRATETRESEDRFADEHELMADQPESPLYVDPKDIPHGKTYRWVRIEAQGAADNKNWAQMTRAGWSPVPRSRHEDRFPVTPMPGMGDTSDGTIIFGGLCLCERDTRLVMRDKKRQEQETLAANESIQGYVEGGNAAIPRFNQSGPVQYDTGGRQAQFKD